MKALLTRLRRLEAPKTYAYAVTMFVAQGHLNFDAAIVAVRSGDINVKRLDREPLLALRDRVERQHPRLAWEPVYGEEWHTGMRCIDEAGGPPVTGMLFW